MHAPTFSIITAARACPDRVHCLVRDLARQSWQRWELVVSVDDPEPGAGAAYAAALRDESRARLSPRKRRATGPGAARNDAVAVAGGDYIVLLDADDSLRDDYLQAFAAHFHRHPECMVALAPTRIVREDRLGDAPILFAPALGASGAVSIDDYSKLLVSTHVVCCRKAHVPWPEDCFAEDVVRDALLVAGAGTVPVVPTEYRARIHQGQYTQTSGLTEREIRQTYVRLAALHPKLAPLFLYRAAANSVFASRREAGDDWYTFWSRHRDEIPLLEEVETGANSLRVAS